jgi:hypothetical protein
MMRNRALLIVIGILLSACAQSYDPGTPVLQFGAPYGSVDLAGWR